MYIRHQFRDTTTGESLAYEPFWSFGDGCTSTARNPVHIYLEEGEYEVTFTLKKNGTEFQTTQPVSSGPDWEQQIRRSKDTISQYSSTLSRYSFRNMKTDFDDLVMETACGLHNLRIDHPMMT